MNLKRPATFLVAPLYFPGLGDAALHAGAAGGGDLRHAAPGLHAGGGAQPGYGACGARGRPGDPQDARAAW